MMSVSTVSPVNQTIGEVTAPVNFEQNNKVRTYRHVPYATSANGDSSSAGSDTASQTSQSATPRQTSHRNSGAAMSMLFNASATSVGSTSPPPQVAGSQPSTPQARPASASQQQAAKKNQPASQTMIVVSEEEFTRNIGNLKRLAFTASGSSLIQAAMRQHGALAIDSVHHELRHHVEAMLMDNHACYVAKLLIECMPRRNQEQVLAEISGNEQLWISMCVRSLHSRRMVQFFLDTYGIDQCAFLVLLVQRNFHTVAMSKEGCVTVQRILDVCGHGVREIFFTFIRCNFVAYSCDQHATYVVQYMMKHGDVDATVDGIVEQIRGANAAVLCGNKYASPVLEKCIATLGARFQHAMVANLFQCMPDETLCTLLNDNYANYVVQALIDHCDMACLEVMAARIASVTNRVQYGRKLQQRIQKRVQQGNNAHGNRKGW